VEILEAPPALIKINNKLGASVSATHLVPFAKDVC
jgi:hypothetical protein